MAKKCSPEDFVRASQTSESIAEIMQKTGLSRFGVIGRGDAYRKKGVPLKSLKRTSAGRKKLDYKALRELAELTRPTERPSD